METRPPPDALPEPLPTSEINTFSEELRRATTAKLDELIPDQSDSRVLVGHLSSFRAATGVNELVLAACESRGSQPYALEMVNGPDRLVHFENYEGQKITVLFQRDEEGNESSFYLTMEAPEGVIKLSKSSGNILSIAEGGDSFAEATKEDQKKLDAILAKIAALQKPESDPQQLARTIKERDLINILIDRLGRPV